MSSVNPMSLVRNLGIAAHIDAGKTTVTERILFYSGRIHRMGTVDEGNTTTDFLPEERERGITIQSAAVTVPWHDAVMNIIDTPGHVDFTAEVERSMRVLDGAVVVFCGYGGVEAQSETVWRQANRYRVPRIVFVNKLDRMGADFDRVVDEVERRLAAKPIAVQFPNGTQDALRGVVDLVEMVELRFDATGKSPEVERVPLEGALLDDAEARREQMIELIAEEDDELATSFLEGGEISSQDLKAAIRRQTIACRIQPVLCGAALRNVGVPPLMDAIVDYLPSPRDIRETEGLNPATGKKEVRKHYPDQPFSGYIFKTIAEEHGDVSFMRIYSGKIAEGERALNSRLDRREKIGRLLAVFADRREVVKSASAGDIVAVMGLKFSATGDTLCDLEHPIAFERVTFPEPVISVALEPRTNADRDRLEQTLSRMTRDDPTLSVRYDEETGQLLMSGMGELHLEVRRHDIEFGHRIPVKVGEPRVSYRECVRGKGEAERVVDSPLGGKPQYARVKLRVERFPNSNEGHIAFASDVPEGAISKVFLPIIEQSVRDSASSGVLRGDPMMDIKATLLEASEREGESTPAAFGQATALAFSDACRNAGPLLLEPIMSFEVVCPEEFLGGVLKDLQLRGAEVNEVSLRDKLQVVTGKVPLARMFEYASQIRSLTQGRGSGSIEPAEYGEVSRQDYLRLVGE